MFSLRHTLMGGAAVCAVAVAATPALAEVQSFDIPAQPARTAIQEFGRQSGLQILASQTDVGDQNVQALKGDYEPREALRRLLVATNLRVASDDGRTVTLAPQSGSAAGDGADGTVQALIVTAQKREEDIQDVPIAISAFTQEDLTRSQVAGGPDLVTQVPNFTFTKTNFSSYSIQIRGIGTQAISATTDPAVAVAFNNTPFIRNRFFEQEFYDLERVEVLRGPQGTLYGRNATAGVVNIISAKPKFRYEAKLSGDVGNFSSSRLEGMVNIPLVEGKVALRIAGAWTKRDGYAVNELNGNPIDGRDLWSTRVSLRVQPTDRLNINLIWEHFQEEDDRLRSGKQLCKKDVVTQVGDVPITDYFDTSTAGGQDLLHAGVQATLSQGCKRNSLYDKSSFQRPNGIMLPYYVPLTAVGLPVALNDPYASVVDTSDPLVISATNDQPEDLRVIQSTVDPQYRAHANIGELQVSFDLTDKLTLSSETGYGTDFVYSLEDFNRFNTAAGAWSQPFPGMREGLLTEGPDGGIFCDPQLGCSDRLVAVDISTAKARQFSQEFRLASNFEGPFNFSLGANFLRADSEDKYYVFFNSISLFMARRYFLDEQPAWIPGVSDGSECLRQGYLPGDPNGVYSVIGCAYIDPNPIESVNDQGHNYFLSKNPYKLLSYAVFGEAYYRITDNLKLTAGLRWTVDKKRAPRIPTWLAATQSVGYPVAEVIQQEWREPTGRLTLDWKPSLSFTDETLLYASLAHGYKAGGANPPGFVRAFYSQRSVAQFQSAESATRPRTFEPEFVNALELGAKNTFAGGRATANLAGFYYDYTGYQVSEIVDRSAFNRNFDATVWGFELETDWRPRENLRLGFKGGYEKTRIADSEQAIDLMDRTAGDPNWVVVRPFPTYASSCILPTYAFANPDGTIGAVGGVGGGGPSGCEIAYSMGLDPVTMAPYVDLAHGGVPGPLPPDFGTQIQFNNLESHPGYPGFDPLTAPNGGEGIMKRLGGNELPNAPHFTATITGDYTLPLANDWLMTLHTDVHWQSQSWWRVFNDDTYDKLHPYFTMNLAAIFANEDAGWTVMAYIKNVTDETAITGAFLNSDDTGLTTNVFLTEPRLYGLRVTKQWTGNSPFGDLGIGGEGPHPLTVELGGQIQRHDAPNQALHPAVADAFTGPLDIYDAAQAQDLDWGDGRWAKVTYKPVGSPWSLAGTVRYGKTNHTAKGHAERPTDPVCGFTDPDYCAFLAGYPAYADITDATAVDNVDVVIGDREEHNIVDFQVGYDLGLGADGQSTVNAGLRYARLTSDTNASLVGIPNWYVPSGFYENNATLTRTLYNTDVAAKREFKGAGPIVSWNASLPLLGSDQAGHLDLDWSLEGGVLFGQQQVSTVTTLATSQFEISGHAYGYELFGFAFIPPLAVNTTLPSVIDHRGGSATVPLASGSLGFSYRTSGFRMGAGYRWERYFDAIDGGFSARAKEDRTIDGPYFKIAVGFGG